MRWTALSCVGTATKALAWKWLCRILGDRKPMHPGIETRWWDRFHYELLLMLPLSTRIACTHGILLWQSPADCSRFRATHIYTHMYTFTYNHRVVQSRHATYCIHFQHIISLLAAAGSSTPLDGAPFSARNAKLTCVSICIHECVCSSVAEHIFFFVRWAVAERLSGNIQRPSHHIVYSLRNTFMQMQLNKSKISLLVCSTRLHMCAYVLWLAAAFSMCAPPEHKHGTVLFHMWLLHAARVYCILIWFRHVCIVYFICMHVCVFVCVHE